MITRITAQLAADHPEKKFTLEFKSDRVIVAAHGKDGKLIGKRAVTYLELEFAVFDIIGVTLRTIIGETK